MALPVEDPGELERSLKEHAAAWAPVTDAPSGIRMQQSQDGKWTIAFNASVIAMAYAPSGEKTIDILADLVLKNNTLTVAQSPLSAIKEQEGHITFTDGNCKGHLDFEKGEINFTALIPVEGWMMNAKAQHRKPAEQSALFMWCYALPESLFRHKSFTAGPVTLYGDSLLATGLKGFELEITEPVVQQDSVVTYDYNDDFEKGSNRYGKRK